MKVLFNFLENATQRLYFARLIPGQIKNIYIQIPDYYKHRIRDILLTNARFLRTYNLN